MVHDRGNPLADSRGRVLLHRKIVLDAGIRIGPYDDVHHINGDKQDNRLENLEVLPMWEHARRHAHERGWIRNQYGTFPLRNRAEDVT